MTDIRTGFQPPVDPATRRAFFDLMRRVGVLDRAVDDLDATVGALGGGTTIAGSQWSYHNSTAPPPATGQLRVDGTLLYLHDIDDGGLNQGVLLNELAPDDRVILRNTSGETEQREVVSVTDSGDYVTLDTTILSGGGSVKKNETVDVMFVREGAAGATVASLEQRVAALEAQVLPGPIEVRLTLKNDGVNTVLADVSSLMPGTYITGTYSYWGAVPYDRTFVVSSFVTFAKNLTSADAPYSRYQPLYRFDGTGDFSRFYPGNGFSYVAFTGGVTNETQSSSRVDVLTVPANTTVETRLYGYSLYANTIVTQAANRSGYVTTVYPS